MLPGAVDCTHPTSLKCAEDYDGLTRQQAWCHQQPGIAEGLIGSNHRLVDAMTWNKYFVPRHAQLKVTQRMNQFRSTLSIRDPGSHAGRYSSASEYVRELIRNDEKQKPEEQLAAQLREGLQSEETALTPDDWKAIRAEALARMAMDMQKGASGRGSNLSNQPARYRGVLGLLFGLNWWALTKTVTTVCGAAKHR